MFGLKLLVAFFEVLGSDGLRAYEEVCDYARAATLLVVADGERGDIGSTARAYADAYLEAGEDGRLPVDALTVNPYLGSDSRRAVPRCVPALRSAGIFCLVKTSNAGSADIQDLALSDGRRVWQQVAELVDEWGSRGSLASVALSSVGAVVGATYPRAVAEARRLMPQAVLLLPGDRRPGRDPSGREREAFTSGPASALVTGLASGHLRVSASTATDWRKSGRRPRPRGSGARSGRRRDGDRPGNTGCGCTASPLRAAFFLAATILVILIERGLNGDAQTSTTDLPCHEPCRETTTTGGTTTSKKKQIYRAEGGRHARVDRGEVRHHGGRPARV